MPANYLCCVSSPCIPRARLLIRLWFFRSTCRRRHCPAIEFRSFESSTTTSGGRQLGAHARSSRRRSLSGATHAGYLGATSPRGPSRPRPKGGHACCGGRVDAIRRRAPPPTPLAHLAQGCLRLSGDRRASAAQPCSLLPAARHGCGSHAVRRRVCVRFGT
jgi:hypothetical protein